MKCKACGGDGDAKGGPREGTTCTRCGGSGEDPETRRQLVSGKPVPEDNSHVALKPNGQQRDYVVLSPEERAKGFLKPVRETYLHLTCKTTTTMGRSIAETYAREPKFYSGTFCCACRTHRPLIEFTWEPDGEPMDTTLQDAWAAEQLVARAAEKVRRRRVRMAELRASIAEQNAELTILEAEEAA